VSEDLKACCATIYESDIARLLLGDSFHPGGVRLTRRLGEILGLRPGARVLDVASGTGESAIFLARTFGCEVTGIDFGGENVSRAQTRAEASDSGRLVRFVQGDAESTGFPAESFDAVICECAFCTFPNKAAAAQEFFRLLKSGGRLGLSDLTRAAVLPGALQSLLAWVACIADARPLGEYIEILQAAGFSDVTTEEHDEALGEMVRDVQGRLMGAEVAMKLSKAESIPVDFGEAREMARAAASAVRAGQLGYAIVTARRAA